MNSHEPLAVRVEKILVDCLFKNDEVVDGKPIVEPIVVHGIIRDFGFHPERIKNNREKIRTLLQRMPKEFHVHGGGGWSFLNLCNDVNGQQWGEHNDMEQLVVLGIAAGFAKWQLPREVWKSLPGGMPYVGFDIRMGA